MNIFRKIHNWLFPPHSAECQRVLSLLEEDEWELSDDPYPYGIRKGRVRLIPQLGWPYSDYVNIYIDGETLYLAFSEREHLAMYKRARRIRERLVDEREERNAASVRASAKATLQRLMQGEL